MSAPIRQRLSLVKLIHTPGISVGAVQSALERRFPHVVAEPRCETLFQFHIRCMDYHGRNRLIVRFGWSAKREGSPFGIDGWRFEALPGDPR